MSKTWHPIVDKEKCVQCGICVNFCENGVYDKTKNPVLIVAKPENCVTGCKGCGKRCPVVAITYFGDSGEATSGCGGCKTKKEVSK